MGVLLSQGSIGIFWSNGLAGSITTLALILLLWPLFGRLRQALVRWSAGGGR